MKNMINFNDCLYFCLKQNLNEQFNCTYCLHYLNLNMLKKLDDIFSAALG